MTVFLAVLKVVLPFAAGALSWAFKRARSKERDLIDTKIHNERLRSVLHRLDEVVGTVVKDLSQTLVDTLRLAADGKLTESAKELLRRQAISKVREYLGSHGMEELGEVLKLAEGALMAFIASKVEAQVLDTKAAQPSIRLPAPTLS